MEIRHIKSFKLVADHGSTRRAAELLFTSQSCVSKNIAALEEELGVLLFERSNRGLSLTSRGRELYEHACNILNGLSLFKSVSGESTPQFLRVASYPSKMISHYLCVLYNELQERDLQERNLREKNLRESDGKHQDTTCPAPAPFNITFLEGSISEIVDYVEKGMADIGIVYFASAQSKAFRHILGHRELVYVELSRHEPCVYLGPRNPFYNRDIITFEELALCNFVQPSKDYFSIEHHIDSISLGMSKAGSFRNVITTNSDNLLIEMLIYTDICTFGIKLLKDACRIQTIRDISIEGCGKCLSLGYIRRKRHELSAEYERFLDLLRTQLIGSRPQEEEPLP